MKTLPCVLICLLLAGCEATTFERAPLAASDCDPRLAGQWESLGDKGDADGDVRLEFDDACRLQLFDRHENEMRSGDATQVEVGEHDGQDYLWVDAGWALHRFDSDLRAEAGDVVVLRYRVSADELVLRKTDDKAIAHLILDDRIRGDTRKQGDELQNRVTGGPHPDVLAMDGVFDDEDLRFARAGGARR